MYKDSKKEMLSQSDGQANSDDDKRRGRCETVDVVDQSRRFPKVLSNGFKSRMAIYVKAVLGLRGKKAARMCTQSAFFRFALVHKLSKNQFLHVRKISCAQGDRAFRPGRRSPVNLFSPGFCCNTDKFT